MWTVGMQYYFFQKVKSHIMFRQHWCKFEKRTFALSIALDWCGKPKIPTNMCAEAHLRNWDFAHWCKEIPFSQMAKVWFPSNSPQKKKMCACTCKFLSQDI